MSLKSATIGTGDPDVTAAFNLEAEMSALGSAGLKLQAADIVLGSLDDEDFYHPAHRLIFRAMASLWRRGEPVDIVTVKDYLAQNRNLQDVGGEDYLIQVLEAVPSSANAEYYADIVRDRRIYRDAHGFLKDSKQTLADEDTPLVDRLSKIQDAAMGIGRHARKGSGPVSLKLIMRQVDDQLDAVAEGRQARGIPTGLMDLDDLTGGFMPGQLIIIGARPSMGKTALAMTMVYKMARAGRRGLVFSHESTNMELGYRLVSMTSSIPVKTMRDKMDPHTHSRVRDAMEAIHELPIDIDDASGITVMDMLTRARALRRTHPDLAYIVVDYLQIVKGAGGRAENRNVEVGQISAGLKHMAKELGVPVIALSQLSRTLEGRPSQRPTMADLRESGSIENDADIIMFVFRENKVLCDRRHTDANFDPHRHEVAELIVAKNRDGELGTASVIFTPEFARFANMAKEKLDI